MEKDFLALCDRLEAQGHTAELMFLLREYVRLQAQKVDTKKASFFRACNLSGLTSLLNNMNNKLFTHEMQAR